MEQAVGIACLKGNRFPRQPHLTRPAVQIANRNDETKIFFATINADQSRPQWRRVIVASSEEVCSVAGARVLCEGRSCSKQIAIGAI